MFYETGGRLTKAINRLQTQLDRRSIDTNLMFDWKKMIPTVTGQEEWRSDVSDGKETIIDAAAATVIAIDEQYSERIRFVTALSRDLIVESSGIRESIISQFAAGNLLTMSDYRKYSQNPYYARYFTEPQDIRDRFFCGHMYEIFWFVLLTILWFLMYYFLLLNLSKTR